MEIRNLHSWNVSLEEAKLLQEKLRSMLRMTKMDMARVSIVAAADIAYARSLSDCRDRHEGSGGRAQIFTDLRGNSGPMHRKIRGYLGRQPTFRSRSSEIRRAPEESDSLFAAVVLLSFPELQLIKEIARVQKVSFPYVPGCLAFREAPAILSVLEEVQEEPDVILVDGHGIAHPRGFGLASHVGLFLDKPTVGCAKDIFTGDFIAPGPRKGSYSYLYLEGEKVGAAVRTRDQVKPVFVSPGHRMDIGTSCDLVLACTTKYRIPEPLRLAHILAKRLRDAVSLRNK